jgi:hypothetical protein
MSRSTYAHTMNYQYDIDVRLPAGDYNIGLGCDIDLDPGKTSTVTVYDAQRNIVGTVSLKYTKESPDSSETGVNPACYTLFYPGRNTSAIAFGFKSVSIRQFLDYYAIVLNGNILIPAKFVYKELPAPPVIPPITPEQQLKNTLHTVERTAKTTSESLASVQQQTLSLDKSMKELLEQVTGMNAKKQQECADLKEIEDIKAKLDSGIKDKTITGGEAIEMMERLIQLFDKYDLKGLSEEFKNMLALANVKKDAE